MMNCDQCNNWKKEGQKDEGLCDSEKFVYEGNVPIDGLMYWDYESYGAGFRTGAKFGCIHFEQKVSE